MKYLKEEIKLPNYNVVDDEVPVNKYALNLVNLIKTINESMDENYEEEFIIVTLKNELNNFFNKFEEFIFNGIKIEDFNCLKQFKRDMIFLKKNLPNIIKNDFKTRIDNINKKVLPENLLKKKK